MKLSILIPTIEKRKKKVDALIKEINKQKNKVDPNLGEIEILIDNSKKFIDGGLTIGAKRDTLLKKAKGEYICFLDDDDNISPEYIQTLLNLCYEGKDVCTFRQLFKCEYYWAIIDFSIKHETNEAATPEKIVNRQIFHVCAIKRSICQIHDFPNINWGEDWEWIQKFIHEIKTEAKTDKIIHQYNHYEKKSESDKIKDK